MYLCMNTYFGLPQPGDLYNSYYFSLASAYSHYGCWGATDDLSDLTTPKYQDILKVTKTVHYRNIRPGLLAVDFMQLISLLFGLWFI